MNDFVLLFYNCLFVFFLFIGTSFLSLYDTNCFYYDHCANLRITCGKRANICTECVLFLRIFCLKRDTMHFDQIICRVRETKRTFNDTNFTIIFLANRHLFGVYFILLFFICIFIQMRQQCIMFCFCCFVLTQLD